MISNKRRGKGGERREKDGKGKRNEEKEGGGWEEGRTHIVRDGYSLSNIPPLKGKVVFRCSMSKISTPCDCVNIGFCQAFSLSKQYYRCLADTLALKALLKS